MPHEPIIHVMSYAQLATSEAPTMMPLYHIDRDDSPLCVPREWADMQMHQITKHYRDYIQNMIKSPIPRVKVAIDNIYDRAINGGVIIATLAQVVPFYTHAHILRDIILELAQGD